MAGSTTTLREAVEAIEVHIVDDLPDLGLLRGDVLTNPATAPQQRGAVGVWVRRELSRNLNEVRDQDCSRVEDLIVVELQTRVKPKDQRDTRGDVYDKEQDVVNRVTDLTFNRRWNLRFVDSREIIRNGEWFVLLVRFSLKRFLEVGAG